VELDVVRAHAHSIDHRNLLARSDNCGCFNCLEVFGADTITEWTDVVNGEGVTALCPRCGLDAVIGSASGFPIERGFLDAMRTRWMGHKLE